MKIINRFGRYVVSTRIDEKFLVNIRHYITKKVIEENKICRLNVCKNCLLNLRYKGYYDHKLSVNIYNNFNLKEFLSQSNPTFAQEPKHNEFTAPPDKYTIDFEEKSLKFREKNKWKCSSCKLVLSDIRYRKFLHTHHINGLKYDNREENFESLCIHCHSEKPGHCNLKSMPDYAEFVKIFLKRKKWWKFGF